MANSVTGNIIAKTHQGLVPVTSDDDKTWARDQAIGEWIQFSFADATATAEIGQRVIFYFPYACTIKNAWLISGNTATADNAEYAEIILKLGTAGVFRTAVSGDTRAASLNGVVAFVPEALTLSSTQANLEAAAGDILTFQKNGTGATSRALTAAAGSDGEMACVLVYVERKYA